MQSLRLRVYMQRFQNNNYCCGSDWKAPLEKISFEIITVQKVLGQRVPGQASS